MIHMELTARPCGMQRGSETSGGHAIESLTFICVQSGTSGGAVTPGGNGTKLRYRLGGCVGEGATGKVFVGLNVSTGDLLAVKQINFDNITREEVGFLPFCCMDKAIHSVPNFH